MPTPLFLFLAMPLLDGMLELRHSELVPEGEGPSFTLTTAGDPVAIAAECTAGGEVHRWLGQELYPGDEAVFTLPRQPSVTRADCAVRVRMANGLFKGESFTLRYAYEGVLTVEAATARLELGRRVLTVQASGKVSRAEVRALGAAGEELYRAEGQVSGGPGLVTVRWDGATAGVAEVEVVLEGPSGAAKVTAKP